MKFDGNQKVFLISSNHPVTIFGRTEFFNGKQPRYYIVSQTSIPGKNLNEDWVNEDQLSATPYKQEIPESVKPKTTTLGKKPGGGIRTKGLGA